MSFSELKDLSVETFRGWQDDDAMQWAAALSYYATLSMAPLLVLVLGLATFAVDEQTLRDQVLTRIRTWVGTAGADIAGTILDSDRSTGAWAGIGSMIFLVVGATGVFGQLQKAMNEVWDVAPEKGGLKRLLRSRLLAFALVLGIGALLVASVAVRAVVTALPAPDAAVELLNLGISLAAFTAVLGAIYKVLPDVIIGWRDVWWGALVTAALFVVGQIAIGLYLGHTAVGSAYGAAGSLVAVLVWVYFSALVFFFGAEFTQVWARRAGRRIVPQDGARRVPP